jgi:hypothetical protein
VNQFVEECRREWRRLRVPKSLANDMAAELESDLAEAADEGVTPEELVGGDARTFARSWAAERGVDMHTRGRQKLTFAILAALVGVAAVGAGLAISAAPARPAAKPLTIVFPPPDATGRVWVQAKPAGIRFVSRMEGVSHDTTRTLGFVLLAAGLSGAIAVTAVSLSNGRRHTLRF